MIAAQLTELPLLESWQDGNPSARASATFPLVGVPGTDTLGVVYFEIAPGHVLATHTDSRDEILVVLSGSGEGIVGDETATVRAGALVFVPAMVPHGVRNTGTEPLRVVGIFAGADVVSTFEKLLQPMGVRVLSHQALAAL
jgi:mannose-6-phosphate isomerase-like protein (cupin superfamily)